MQKIEENLRAMEELNKKFPWGEYKRCVQCGRKMNIVDYLVSSVCRKCAKRNHKKITKG